jgi:urease accessory protein
VILYLILSSDKQRRHGELISRESAATRVIFRWGEFSSTGEKREITMAIDHLARTGASALHRNLRLLQLGDSALPIGGYSQSWGLEAAVDRGLVRDPPSLEGWVRHWLRCAAAPLEGIVVAASCRAAGAGDWPALRAANELLWISITPETLRHASRDLGEQLVTLAGAWPWAMDSARALRQVTPRPWHHAPVFATLAAAAGAGPADAVAIYLQQAALGVIGAGVRAIPIGHTHGQQILAALQEEIAALAADLADRDLKTAGSFGPAYEVLCHAQSRLYTRLFRS